MRLHSASANRFLANSLNTGAPDFTPGSRHADAIDCGMGGRVREAGTRSLDVTQPASIVVPKQTHVRTTSDFLFIRSNLLFECRDFGLCGSYAFVRILKGAGDGLGVTGLDVRHSLGNASLATGRPDMLAVEEPDEHRSNRPRYRGGRELPHPRNHVVSPVRYESTSAALILRTQRKTAIPATRSATHQNWPTTPPMSESADLIRPPTPTTCST